MNATTTTITTTSTTLRRSLRRLSMNNPPYAPPKTSIPMEREASCLVRLVLALQSSLTALGAKPTNAQLESWAVLIHECMSSSCRNFHSCQHVFDVSYGAEPIQVISALFHDVIYKSVDGGLSSKQAAILEGVITEGPDNVVILNEIDATADPLLAMVAAIFGFESGCVLQPFGGENEFLSAIVAVRELHGTLGLAQLAQIAVCIEATIPFRSADKEGRRPPERLYARLCEVNDTFALHMKEEDLVKAVQQAVDVANRDVGNFCTTDHSWFLHNTWKLLSESNVPLRHRNLCTVSDYQLALMKIERFFTHLDPCVVFNTFRGAPDKETRNDMTLRAAQNIEIGRRYIRSKVLSLSVIAALAELTGGDTPVSLFMGDLPSAQHLTVRLDDFIPQETECCSNESGLHINRKVYELLANGLKSDSKFDSRRSPLAAYLYGLLGDDGVEDCLRYAVNPMDKDNARNLLESIPRDAVEAIAENAALMALTRADKLKKILDKLP